MKKRVKGLLALALTLCMVMGMTLTVQARDVLDDFEDGTQNFFVNNGTEILYEGDTVGTNGASGEGFVPLDENYNILPYGDVKDIRTLRSDSGQNTKVAIVTSSPSYEPYRPFVVPANKPGYYGYAAKLYIDQMPKAGIFTDIDTNKPIMDTVFRCDGETMQAIVFTPRPIVFHFNMDANGGVLTDDAAAALKGGTTDQLSNPTREGYDFAGWNTKPDGTAVAFDKDTTAATLAKEMSEDTATDKNKVFTPTFVEPEDTESASRLSEAAGAFTKAAGYEESVANTETFTLYAQWKVAAAGTGDGNQNQGQGITAAAANVTAPKTGDNGMMLALIVVLLVMSGCGIVYISRRRKSVM